MVLAAADAVTLLEAWPSLVGVAGGLVVLTTLIARRDSSRDETKKKLDGAQTKEASSACRVQVDESLRKLKEDLVERIQKLNDEVKERPSRESLAEAFRAIRELEGRVVDGEKNALEMRGDLKLVLGATAEMRQMLAQLQSDVSVIALNQRRPVGRQRTGGEPEEG